MPGRTTPTSELLEQYKEANAARRGSLDRALWSFFAPDASNVVHWRAELECGCGCVHDLLLIVDKYDESGRPYLSGARDPVDGFLLPEGQRYCGRHPTSPTPYRRIVEWGNHSLLAT